MSYVDGKFLNWEEKLIWRELESLEFCGAAWPKQFVKTQVLSCCHFKDNVTCLVNCGRSYYPKSILASVGPTQRVYWKSPQGARFDVRSFCMFPCPLLHISWVNHFDGNGYFFSWRASWYLDISDTHSDMSHNTALLQPATSLGHSKERSELPYQKTRKWVASDSRNVHSPRSRDWKHRSAAPHSLRDSKYNPVLPLPHFWESLIFGLLLYGTSLSSIVPQLSPLCVSSSSKDTSQVVLPQ